MMYPYALDGIPDKGNILEKNLEDLISNSLSKIIIDRKAKKRNTENIDIQNNQLNKRQKKEIKEDINSDIHLKKMKVN